MLPLLSGELSFISWLSLIQSWNTNYVIVKGDLFSGCWCFSVVVILASYKKNIWVLWDKPQVHQVLVLGSLSLLHHFSSFQSCVSHLLSCFISGPSGHLNQLSKLWWRGLYFIFQVSHFPLQCSLVDGTRGSLSACVYPWSRWNEKHLIVWRRFSAVSIREPAELRPQNQVNTCRETRCFLYTA